MHVIPVHIIVQQAKVWLGTCIVQKSKIRHSWGFLPVKCRNKILLRLYYIEKDKIRCNGGLIMIKLLK